ncbi:MAG: methyltransferase domain-containing protein [Actinobacteria bacterium]|nr:methyltransferase domain-containing protein [Actinomycetota bacterium]
MLSNDADPGFLRPALRSALYTIQNQVSDFRLIRYVVEMSVTESLRSGGSVHPNFIKVLFEEDPYLRETFETPGITINPAGHLRVHEKGKTELLCDLLLSIYESREELLDVAELEMDEGSLRIAREQGTLRETVTALCLTTSPVTVVNSLVPTRDLVAELRRRRLHRSQESKVKADRVGLLLKGLGFTYAPPLHGLKDIEGELRDIVELVGSDRSSVAPRIGGTWQAVASGESILLDLLHFWARVLFGSIETLTNTINREGSGRRPLDASRLALGEVLRLLRRLRRSIREEGAPLVARLTDSEILNEDFLRTADDFVQLRNTFVHDSAEGSKSELLEKLTVCALELVLRADEAGYPAVIEVAEIVFDRYGRQIFRGSDSADRSLTFAVSDEGEAARLEVAATYFMLPTRLVSTDPVLVPTSRTGGTVLFGEATEYAKHSDTQVRQADQLFDMLPALSGDEDILDIGCGDGRITARLGLLVPNGHVMGLDVSQSMIDLASSSHRTARNMSWVVGIAEDLGFEQAFDVVFSNAALHWTTDPGRSISGIHRALRPGGTFLSHQGGHGTYAGLRSVVVRLIEDRGLGYLFNGWKYPTWYPTVEEIRELLTKSGFIDVAVNSVITDGSELPTLVTDFARAGLLPYLERLPAVEVHAFTEEFIELATVPGIDLTTHRLFISARRSDD